MEEMRMGAGQGAFGSADATAASSAVATATAEAIATAVARASNSKLLRQFMSCQLFICRPASAVCFDVQALKNTGIPCTCMCGFV